jgi:hypothetical protein
MHTGRNKTEGLISPSKEFRQEVSIEEDGFGGLVVSMLASGSRVRRSRWIFNEC